MLPAEGALFQRHLGKLGGGHRTFCRSPERELASCRQALLEAAGTLGKLLFREHGYPRILAQIPEEMISTSPSFGDMLEAAGELPAAGEWSQWQSSSTSHYESTTCDRES